MENETKKFTKSKMIEDIIATNKILESCENGKRINNDLLPYLNKYFEGKYTMNKKRALHNIISNILLKETLTEQGMNVIKTIISMLSSKFKEDEHTNYAIIDSIIFIIDKLYLVGLDKSREELLDIIKKHFDELGETTSFIKAYIDNANENADKNSKRLILGTHFENYQSNTNKAKKEDEESNELYSYSSGGSKLKKIIKKPKGTKKPKKINTYTKPELEKIAKKHKVSLKKRDGTKKNKEELFKSLKRKALV
jgi:hypothetical protein